MNSPVQQAVEAAYQNWIKAAVTGDADEYAEFFCEEGVLMPPNAPPMHGRKAIREWAAQFFSSYKLNVSTYSMEQQIIFDAVAVSRYVASGTYLPVSGGAGIPFDQKYIDILVKEVDGVWRMNAHMWSSNCMGRSVWASTGLEGRA